jgi:hypothetical protein
MPPVERCVASLAAASFAAVYVLLLVGFTGEFYVTRGQGLPAEPAALGVLRVAPACERPVCADGAPAGSEQAGCALSIHQVRQMLLAR